MRAITKTTCLAAVTLITVAGPAGLAEPSKTGVPVKPDDRTIVHVLNRLGFGPGPGDIDNVRRIGLQAYIDRQLTPERIDDAALAERLATLTTLSKSTREVAEQYYLPAQMARRQRQKEQNAQPQGTDAEPRQPPMAAQPETVQKERQALGEVMQAKILRAAYSERQLEEVMVDFWFNHFNVFAGKGPIRIYLNEYERDAIRPHVLGKFHDLLAATAESPAMLFYLDNWQSAAAEGAPTTTANVRRLNPGARPPDRFRPGRVRPGVAPRRPAQMPIEPPIATENRRRGLNENYAREIMELHTLGVEGGYTQKDVQEVARAFTGWTIANPRQGGAFRFEPRMHDDGDKVVLGHKIRGGGGKKDGDEVLVLLAKHPSTARFISTKLARRFVADEPPAALVDRAAQRFRETDGDIREVVRTIVTSPEFFAAESYRAKVKTPFEFVVSAIRATNTEVVNAQLLVGAVRNLGMPLYGCQPPTGYADKAEAWVNSGALLNRMNFAVSLSSSQTRGMGGRPPQDRAMAPPSVTSETLVASVLARDLSGSTAATIANAATSAQALALVLGSPEFQKR